MTRVSAALLLLMAMTACGQPPMQSPATESRVPSVKEDSARMAAMKAEILALINEPRCSQSSECAAAAFGSKPCGGPWTYLVYSKSTVDESVLLDGIDEYNRFNTSVNRRHGLVSDCMLVGEPRVDCVEGLCVIAD